MRLVSRGCELNKTSIFAASHSFPLNFGLWRETDSTAPTISGMTFRLFPASLTNRLESDGRPCDNPTVLYLMAVLAESDAIRYIVSRFRIFAPFLDVMGMYRSHCAAFLAGEIIALKNSGDPLFIFISAVSFGIRNLCGLISTTGTAIFRFWMSAPLLKLRTTEGAYSHWGSMSNLITFIGAIDIRRLGNLYNEILPADRAGFCPACIAEHSFRLSACKWLSARLANGRVNLFIFGLVKAHVAKVISARDRLPAYLAGYAARRATLGMISLWLKFIMAAGASFHVLIIHFLQRVSRTIPGIKRRMTDAFLGIEIRRIEP